MKQILLSKENAIMNKKLLQPDQLPLSAPDHRAARQLREKVLLSENKIHQNKNRAGGENVAGFDHEPASSIWAAHSSQLPGESGWTRKNSCHQRIVFKVLSKLLPGLESGRTGNGGRGVTGEHLQVSFFSPVTRFMCLTPSSTSTGAGTAENVCKPPSRWFPSPLRLLRHRGDRRRSPGHRGSPLQVIKH